MKKRQLIFSVLGTAIYLMIAAASTKVNEQKCEALVKTFNVTVNGKPISDNYENHYLVRGDEVKIDWTLSGASYGWLKIGAHVERVDISGSKTFKAQAENIVYLAAVKSKSPGDSCDNFTTKYFYGLENDDEFRMTLNKDLDYKWNYDNKQFISERLHAKHLAVISLCHGRWQMKRFNINDDLLNNINVEEGNIGRDIDFPLAGKYHFTPPTIDCSGIPFAFFTVSIR